MSKINKPRLGRGLSSLISVDDGDESQSSHHGTLNARDESGTPVLSSSSAELLITQRIIEVGVDEVRANPHQPRREFTEASLQELASSLKTNGVIQPIVLRQSEGGYELIAGERRLRAAKLAGLVKVPAIVKEVDGLTQAQLALVENIQREDLNPIDRAMAYKSLVEQLGLSHAELAMRLGEERSTISNHLRLLELAAPVCDLIRSGALSLGHAKVLAGVNDISEQERLSKLVTSQALSVRNLESLVKRTHKAEKPKKSSSSAHIKGLEKSIGRQLGMQVTIRSKVNGKGRLVINYANLDQFDDLMLKLGVKVSEDD